MRIIFAEYNPQRNSIDVYTSAGYMLRIDCWEAEKDLKTTPGSDCALNALAIDEPLEYARLYLDGNFSLYQLQCKNQLFISLGTIASLFFQLINPYKSLMKKIIKLNATGRYTGFLKEANIHKTIKTISFDAYPNA